MEGELGRGVTGGQGREHLVCLLLSWRQLAVVVVRLVADVTRLRQLAPEDVTGALPEQCSSPEQKCKVSGVCVAKLWGELVIRRPGAQGQVGSRRHSLPDDRFMGGVK